MAVQTIAGLIAFLFVPWYGIEDGFFSTEWIWFYPADPESGPAPWQILQHGKVWLLPYLLFLVLPLVRRGSSRLLLIAGIGGLAWGLLQGFSIGALGWSLHIGEILRDIDEPADLL